MTNPIPIVLDCDPGHDDAIALLLAHTSPKLKILGITTSCGNQTVEKTTRNALRICTLLGIAPPLARGCARPLVEPPMNAPSVHGESGLDGPALPEPNFAPVPQSAVALTARLLRESPEKVTLVSTGPMTNTAALLLAHPELKDKIARISLMGGGIAHGNWTPAAEFNILADPEAAQIVFSSGLPILMAGLDVTEQALIYPEDIVRIRALGNPVASVVADWLDFFSIFHRNLGYTGAPLHDPVAVAALIAPELFDIRPMHVEIETEGEFCRGATVGDPWGTPNVQCVMGLDREAFADLLVRSIAAYGGNGK